MSFYPGLSRSLYGSSSKQYNRLPLFLIRPENLWANAMPVNVLVWMVVRGPSWIRLGLSRVVARLNFYLVQIRLYLLRFRG